MAKERYISGVTIGGTETATGRRRVSLLFYGRLPSGALALVKTVRLTPEAFNALARRILENTPAADLRAVLGRIGA